MEREKKWEWINSAVEMIPFGLLAGFFGEKEIRITKLAEEGFCFRLSAASEITELQEKLRLCFYDMKQKCYQEIMVTPATWQVEVRTEFFISYAVAVQQEAYRAAVRMLFGQYDRYIRLKLEEDDSGLAEQMTGYPAEEDAVFAESFQEQMEAWFGSGRNETADLAAQLEDGAVANQSEANREGMEEKEPGETTAAQPELALELDHPCVYTQFLSQRPDDFLTDYENRYPVFRDWFQGRNVDRIYIGNAFCHLLFPEETRLFSMLDRANEMGKNITITFSYVREYQLEYTEKLLEKLEDWCGANEAMLEIVVNDWALADMLKGRTYCLKPCLGILLNKRKKDPRVAYKKGKAEFLRENSLNAEFYREYLNREFKIRRFEWESCGYEQQFPEKTMNSGVEMTVENHLHLPFYQTNTSQYCTLYAGSAYGDRSRQHLLTSCDKRCEWQAYLYPRHLDMAGRGNSLFGKDSGILEQAGIVPCDSKKTRKFCKQNHIGRLVFPCWM